MKLKIYKGCQNLDLNPSLQLETRNISFEEAGIPRVWRLRPLGHTDNLQFNVESPN